MNILYENVVERPVNRLMVEMETISAFRWHYYLILLISLLIFCSIITTVCAKQEEQANKILNTPNPAVECLKQINGLISYIKK